MQKQDILLFMVDQLSAKWLEAAIENDICLLPNIKQLLSEGTYFSNAITSNPVCCPTRATIATGLTTRGHGVLENGYELDTSLPTFMRSLQTVGYKTSAFGKLHFMPHYKTLYPDYKQYGFDVTHITEDVRGGEWLDWVLKNDTEYTDDILATIWPYKMSAFKSYGEDGENLSERIEEIRKEYVWKTEKHPENSPMGHSQKYPKELCQTEWITKKAITFINETEKDVPIFAQVSYVQPHSPFNCPEEYLDMVDDTKIPLPVAAEWLQDEHSPQYFKTKKPMVEDNEMFLRKVYFADLVHLDEKLGEIVKAMKENGRYDNCNIIFLSDHGELLGDHGFYGKEERHYDACIRVPIIIKLPNAKGGNVCSEFIQHEDICPTILEMSKSEFPPMPILGVFTESDNKKLNGFYGKSILPLCKGSNEGLRSHAYVESYNPIWSADYTDWARTIRNDKYRYTYYSDYSGEQLFDLINDPDEQINLAGVAEYEKTKQKLKDALLEAIIKQDYPKTRRNLYSLGVH